MINLQTVKDNIKSVYVAFIIVTLGLLIIATIGYITSDARQENIRIERMNDALDKAKSEQFIIDKLNDSIKIHESIRDKHTECAQANSNTGMLVDCVAYSSIYKAQAQEVITSTGTTSTGVTNTGTVAEVKPKRILKPEELFYTTALADKCHVSQTEESHYLKENGGVLATDIACRFDQPKAQRAIVYAPDYLSEVREYVVLKVGTDSLLGNYIELEFCNDQGPTWCYGQSKWVIAHIETKLKEGDIVTTGTVIGQMNLSGATTGYHSHVELWKMIDNKWTNMSTTTRARVLDNKRQGKLDDTVKLGDPIYFTHYAVGDTMQNDSTPCQAAGGEVCNLQKSGTNVIALTADVRNLYGIKLGDMVKLNGPCAGTYKVMDEKAQRYRYSCIRSNSQYCNKGDISVGVATPGRLPGQAIQYEYMALSSCTGGDHTITKL